MDANDAADHRRGPSASEGLRTVLDAAPVVLFALDAEGIFLTSEGSGLAGTGLPPGELVGRSALEVFGGLELELDDGSTLPVPEVLPRLLAGESFSGLTRFGGRTFHNHLGPTSSGSEAAAVGVAVDVTERVEATEQLARSERLLAATLDSLDAAVLVVGPPHRGVTRVCNASVGRIFGCTPEELAGETTERLHPDREAFERFGRESERALEASGRFETVTPLRREDGSLFTAHVTVTSLEPEHGWRAGVVSVIHDVTEARRIERELRDSEQRFRSIFEHAGLGVALCGLDGRIVEPNPALCDMLGYDRDRLIGMSYDEITHPDDLAPERPLAEALLAGEREAYTLEKRYLCADGETVWVRMTATLLRGPAGEPRSALAMVEDVTAERRARAELETSEERFRRAFEEAPVGAVLLAPDLRIRRANRVFVELSGYSRGELEGMVATDLTLPEDLDPTATERVLTEGPVRGLVRRYRRKGGGVFWGRVSAGAIRDRDGRPLEVLAMIEDISDAIRATEQRERLLAEVRTLTTALAEAEQAERRALARELHDTVGQDLAALSLNLGLVRRLLGGEASPELDTRLAESLEIVEEVGERVRDVMAELRPPMLDDYGLAATLRWLGGRFSDRSGLVVRVRAKEPEPRLAAAAETTLLRVAQEALANVEKHAAATRVTVTLHSAPALVRLSVTDDGRGFEPNGVPAATNGGGWGLIGMRERVEALGGRFRIDSAPEHGTRVVAELER